MQPVKQLFLGLILLLAIAGFFPAAQALPSGYALDFSPYNNYVSVSLNSPPANNYTLTAWVYLRTGGTFAGARVAVLGGPACGSSVELLVHSQTSSSADPQYLELGRCGSFNGVPSTAPVPLNVWTHLAVSVSAANVVTYYINGLAAGTWTNVSDDFSLGTTVELADNLSARIFDGRLNNFQIWNRVLSPAEILSNLNQALTGGENGLYAWYPFREGSGFTTADAVLATPPAGSAGTLVNSPLWIPVGLVVTNSNDSGAGSLRQAVLDSIPGQIITFATNLSGGTINLTGGELLLSQSLTIDASLLPGGIQINANTNSRIFEVNSGSGANVSLNWLNLTNGADHTGKGGGAIYNANNLTLNHCNLSGNIIPAYPGGMGGGAIFNNGSLTLNQCTLAGNTDFDPYAGGGGGIYSDGGTVTLTQCTFSGNSAAGSLGGSGGALYLYGNATLNECTLSGNSAAYEGGGIYVYLGPVTLNQCTLNGNAATGSPNISSSTAVGGGIYSDYGPVFLNACTLTGNSAGYGGGIYNFNGNQTTDGSFTVFNSIIAGNSQIIGPDIFSSALTLTGLNLTNGAPLLGPLGNYGGPTQTMPPLPGSPAIDAGSDSVTNSFSTDQLGLPRLAGMHADIGAVEAQPARLIQTLPATTLTGPTATLNGAVTPGTPVYDYFAYGSTTNYGSFTATNLLTSIAEPVLVANVVSNLLPAITDHYQFVVIDAFGSHGGGDLTFTAAVNVPALTGLGVTNIGADRATLLGQVNPGGALTYYYFEYGLTPQYGFSTPVNTMAASYNFGGVTQTIQGLMPNALYYYQIVAWNSRGTNVAAGSFNSAVLHLVSSTNDDGTAGTLRSILANAASGDFVAFAAPLAGASIFLTQGQIVISNTVSIDASGLPGGIQMNGNHATSLFYIQTNGSVVMTSLTLSNGLAQGAIGSEAGPIFDGGVGQGGAIYNAGLLTLNQCTLAGNVAQGGDGGVNLSGVGSSGAGGAGRGGAIYNAGALTLNQCILMGNLASGGYGGQGIQSSYSGLPGGNGGPCLGGAVFNTGTLIVNGSTLTGDSTTGGGGGRGGNGPIGYMFFPNGGAGGSGGDGDGGAIGNAGLLTLNQSTVTGDAVMGGVGGNGGNGGVNLMDPMAVSAGGPGGVGGTGAGGAIWNTGTLIVNQATLANESVNGGNGGAGGINGGGGSAIGGGPGGQYGLEIFSGPGFALFNSIVTGTNVTSVLNISGSVTNDAPNLLGGDPRLAPLANYGGPTPTMPPVPGSPAVDGSTNGTAFNTDQRGFPRVVGAFADLGAVEGVYNPAGPGKLTGPGRLGNGWFRFTLTNSTDMSFIVLASTNAALPLSAWLTIGLAVESPAGSGNYEFTDPQAAQYPQRFYCVIPYNLVLAATLPAGTGTTTVSPRLANGTFQSMITAFSGLNATLLASTNLLAPLNTWSNLGPVLETLPGIYYFTDPRAASYPQRFYRLRSP